MINLMPDEAKQELRAARTNTLLIRYMAVIVMAFAFLVMILGGSYYLLDQTRQSSLTLIDANDTKAAVYSSTQQQVTALSSQLAGAKSILNQEILYSNVLVNFAQQMPGGTVIDEITLNNASFAGTPLTLKVFAKSTSDAVALRDRFQKSPYFTQVSFQNISDSAQSIEGYPVSATMTLTLNRSIAQ